MATNFSSTITGSVPDPSEGMIASFSVDGTEPTIMSQEPAATITMDDLPRAAYDQGLVQAVQDINVLSKQEALQEQGIPVPQAVPVLPPEPSVPIEVASPTGFVKKKQRAINKRFDDLVARAYEAENERDKIAQERDVYALRAQEIEYQLLLEKDRKLTQDLESLSGIMKQAHTEQDSDAYVEANKLVAQVSQQKHYNEQELLISQKTLEQKTKGYQEVLDQSQGLQQGNQERNDLFKTLSHNRELNSEDYQDWLNQNDYYNPYSSDFDPHMAQDVREIKNDINRFLHAHGASENIGTARYYEELDRKIQEKAVSRFQPTVASTRWPGDPDPQHHAQGGSVVQASPPPATTPPVSSAPYYPSHSESSAMANFHSGNLTATSTAPVTRGGYQTPYGNTPAPAEVRLNEHEMNIAKMCPMYAPPDPANPRARPRLLNDDEKFERYQHFKNQIRSGGAAAQRG